MLITRLGPLTPLDDVNELGDDVFVKAFQEMTKLSLRDDLEKVPLIDLQTVLNVIDQALDVMANIWPPVQSIVFLQCI